MRDSLIILMFFAVGVVLGITGVLPFDISQTDIAMYALYALIFVVGFSIGNNPDIVSSFRKLNPSLALLPLCTVLGTLAASALLGLILPRICLLFAFKRDYHRVQGGGAGYGRAHCQHRP